MNQNICINCQHWLGNREIEPGTPLLAHWDEWREGNCLKLEHVLKIVTMPGDNDQCVDTISTCASFGCVAFEPVEEDNPA